MFNKMFTDHNERNSEMVGFIGIRLCLFLLALPALIVPPQFTQAGISRIWAVGDGEKVKKTDNNHPLATSTDNPVWNGRKVSLFGAKNEVIAFQLIIEADGAGVKNVDVTLDSLTNGSYVIKNTGSSDPFDYVGKKIELFTEHYLHVKTRTSGSWFWNVNAKPSDYYLGWVPDCLIPFAAPGGLGGSPFDIAANNNQAVWIDIYIPRDALAGNYVGNLEVRVNSKVINTIPISLKVYNLILPDETHLQNMFCMSAKYVADRHGIPQKGRQAESGEYYNLEARYHQMAHRHRFDIVRSVKNLEILEKYHKRYLIGELYNALNNYEGPGENVGNRTFSVGPYNNRPEEFSPDNKAGWRAGSDAWVNWFKANAPDVEIHKYLRDEPWSHGAFYDDIIERCKWIHNNPGPGSALITYVTCPIITELQGHCDFWSMTGAEGYNQSLTICEQSKGRKVGIYNGYRPCYGAVVIDADAVEFRVIPWICWKHNLDQYFYWGVTCWREYNNVFVGLRKNKGDGTFFYPGEDKLYPKQDRGLRGPLSSIRMKNWRRGMQDYEYLWLARQSGLESEVDAIVKNCVPTSLDEADRSKDITWSGHGYGFELYRKQLANLIVGRTGTIRGVVRDKGTGNPVQGAKVTDGIRTGTADAAGCYTIDSVIGTHPVIASATGHKDSAQTFVTVIENGTIKVNLQLIRDTIPPIISNVRATKVASSRAIITWNTDEAGNSLVKYGTSPGIYTKSVSDSSYATAYSINISGLSPDTIYYYIVKSAARTEVITRLPQLSASSRL